MSENGEQKTGPLTSIDTYSGKIYWLNPPSGKTLDLENLKEELHERTFQEDISDDYETENVTVPAVFEKDGKMVRTTTTDDVKLVTYNGFDIVTGDVVLDNISRITYRDEEILILDTTEAKFAVFEKDDFYYLAILARRELANSIVDIFREEFPQFGSTINKTRLGSDAIGTIRDSLDATLMDTIITDYDQSEITKTRIKGEDYQDTSVYDSIDRGGKVKSHMFQTDDLVPEDTKTVSIGRDGLVRIYSNATLRTYIKLLEDYVIPEVHRDVESSPSVGAWQEVGSPSEGSIFKDK